MASSVTPRKHGLSAFVHTALRQSKLNGLAEMLRFIAETFDAYGCILWRLGPGATLEIDQMEGRLFVLAQWLKDPDVWGPHVLPIESNTGIAISTGRSVNVRDVRSDPRVDQSDPLWCLAGVRTFCSIPTKFLDGHLGAVNVYRTGMPFDDDDVSHIEEFALLVPTLYQAIRDRVGSSLAGRMNDILNDAELNAAEDPCSIDEMKSVIQRICNEVGSEFHAAEVSVFFEDRFLSVGRYGLVGSTWKDEFRKTEYGTHEPALTSWILTNAKPVNVFDLADFRNEREKGRIQNRYPGLEWADSLDFQSKIQDFFPAAQNHGLRPISFIGAPVTAGKEVLGVIRCCAALGPPYYFEEGELRLLESVAAQIAQYWMRWNARREAEEENRAWRTFVEQVREMNRHVQNEVIAGVLNEEHVYQEALEIAEASVRGAETLDIRLLDESASELYYGPTRGSRWKMGSKEERATRLAVRYKVDENERSIGAKVIRSGESFVMNGPDSNYAGPFHDTTAMIAVPLRARDRTVGVLDIRTSERFRFPKYALAIAELLGQQLGLYRELANAMRGLRQAQGDLEKLLRTQSETYEDLGHQLRSPVFQAQARIQSVLRSKPDLDAGVLSQLNAVRGLIGKTKRVSMSIRLFAQLAEKVAISSQPAVLDPEKLVQSLYEYASDHKRLSDPARELLFNVERRSFGVLRANEVRVDYDLLEQVLNNVLDNAFKYSFSRSIVRIFGGISGPGRFHITVTNKGIRLRSTEIAEATKRGWRSEDAESATGEGSGIGLWIVDQIMRASGGELKIHPTSAEDLTEVKLIFPIVKGAAD